WIIGQGAGSFTTVMERLEPESLYKRFVAFREGLGMEVLPASGGGRPFAILAQRLQAGKLVCLPCDRDVTGHGIEVDFFGEKARMSPGPAALAAQNGAALMPVVLWFEGDGWGVDVGAEIPVPDDDEGDGRERVVAMTQQLARFFEDGIREHPQDWHMLQRVFTADLDPERLAAARRRAAAGEPADLLSGLAWEVPGGVQEHVRGLADALIDLGHHVSVIAPANEDEPVEPGYVVPAGRAVPVPYNGSVARLAFGFVSASR